MQTCTVSAAPAAATSAPLVSLLLAADVITMPRRDVARCDWAQTIIHLHLATPAGYELSGYIDYAARLSRENWAPYFQGRRQLSPAKGDLAFYHWRMDHASCKSSANFKVSATPCDAAHGVLRGGHGIS